MSKKPLTWGDHLRSIGVGRIYSKTMMYAILTCAMVLSGGQDTSPHSSAMLVSSASVVQPGVPFWLGVRITMDKDWHNYWLNPGDSGQATDIKWKLPEGWKAGTLKWPIPEAHLQDGFTMYIYEDEVILMSQVTPPKTAKVGSTISLGADTSWLICEASCIPAKEKVSIRLPIGTKVKPSVTWAPRIAEVQKLWPQPASAWQFSAFQDGEDIILRGISKGAFKAPDKLTFLPADGDTIRLMPAYGVKPETNGFTMRMPVSEYATKKPTKLKGVLVAPEDRLWNKQAPGFELDVKISNQTIEGDTP